jgi:hypothetical protein
MLLKPTQNTFTYLDPKDVVLSRVLVSIDGVGIGNWFIDTYSLN